MAARSAAYWKAKLITGYQITEADYDDLVDTFFKFLDNNLPIGVALAQLDTDIEAAVKVATLPLSDDITFISAFVNVDVAPVGTNIIYDINITGVGTILSTKLTIEVGETSSLTAASQPVFSTANGTQGQQLTVDCDQVGAITPGQNPVLVILYQKTV